MTRSSATDLSHDDDGAVVGTSPAIVESIVAAEMGSQITSARQYPRDIKRALATASQLATLTSEGAVECMYTLKRKDKDGKVNLIEGPSVRLAEILISAWGNCRAGARVVSEDAEFVTAQGVFFDLEANTALTFEVKRRITTSSGKRFGADMIAVTANAACSIALRNSVLKGIPKALWQPVYVAARKAAIGDTRTITARISEAVRAFEKAGAAKEDLLRALGAKSETDLGEEHLLILKGLWNALKAGEVSIDDAFKPDGPVERQVITLMGDSTPPGQAPAVGPPAQPLAKSAASQAQDGNAPEEPEPRDETSDESPGADAEAPPILLAIEDHVRGARTMKARRLADTNRTTLESLAVNGGAYGERAAAILTRFPRPA